MCARVYYFEVLKAVTVAARIKVWSKTKNTCFISKNTRCANMYHYSHKSLIFRNENIKDLNHEIRNNANPKSILLQSFSTKCI